MEYGFEIGRSFLPDPRLLLFESRDLIILANDDLTSYVDELVSPVHDGQEAIYSVFRRKRPVVLLMSPQIVVKDHVPSDFELIP